jgi:hypothetical protein
MCFVRLRFSKPKHCSLKLTFHDRNRIIKHCQKTALYIDDKDKMNEFVTAANHWIKKEKGIRRILVDLGQKDEGSDDDNEEGEDDEEDDEEDDDDGDRENEDDDDDDDDGDGEEEEEEEEEEDLPPPDIDTRTGKRLRY